MGKSNCKWQFSIAMLNHQMVIKQRVSIFLVYIDIHCLYFIVKIYIYSTMEERCLDNGMCMYIIVYICIYYITIIKVHHYIMEYIYIYTIQILFSSWFSLWIEPK